MNFKSLTDPDLLGRTKNKVQQERNVTLEVLHLLREVERRRLFAKRGFSSLHAFCVQELKYSDSAAQRRIQSMRLLVEVPEIEESVQNGNLTLTTVSTAQTFFMNEKKKDRAYSPREKMDLLKEFEGKSKREVEKALFTLSPVSVPRERERVVSENQTELRIVVSDETLEKLKRIKDLLSNKRPNATYAELLEEMAELALDKLDPCRKKGRTRSPDQTQGKSTRANGSQAEPEISMPPAVKRRNIESNRSRYIPANTRRSVWKRAGGRCTYKDPATGRVCGSTHKIQYEHLIPFAKGGSNEPDNLTLSCSTHQKLTAIREFGEDKMKPYLRV